MRGVLRRPSKMLLALEADFVGAASAGAMALKADATLTRQLAAARSGKSIIVAPTMGESTGTCKHLSVFDQQVSPNVLVLTHRSSA